MITRAVLTIALIVLTITLVNAHDVDLAAAMGVAVLVGVVGLALVGWLAVLFKCYGRIEP